MGSEMKPRAALASANQRRGEQGSPDPGTDRASKGSDEPEIMQGHKVAGAVAYAASDTRRPRSRGSSSNLPAMKPERARTRLNR